MAGVQPRSVVVTHENSKARRRRRSMDSSPINVQARSDLEATAIRPLPAQRRVSPLHFSCPLPRLLPPVPPNTPTPQHPTPDTLRHSLLPQPTVPTDYAT